MVAKFYQILSQCQIKEVVVVGTRVRLHQSESGWRYVVELTHGDDALAWWMVGWDGWVVRWKWNRLDFPISNGSIGRHSHWSLVESRSDSKPRNYSAKGYPPASGGQLYHPTGIP